jgi:hypothetical protein
VLSGATIGHSAVTISLKENKMLADIAELEIDEGTRGGGQIRIDMSGEPSFGVQGKLEVADVGRVVGDVRASDRAGPRRCHRRPLRRRQHRLNLLGSLGGKLCVTLEGGRGLDINQLTAAARPHHPARQTRAPVRSP